MMRSTAGVSRFNSRAKNHQKLFLLLVVIMIVLFVAPAHTFGVTYLKDGNYLYLKTSTTTCSIEEYLGTGGEVIIPSSIKGLKVTEIGPLAFYNVGTGYELTKITIPNTVKTIRNDAFSRNYYLTSITIPNSVRDINSRAFDYCYYLNSVKFGTGVRFIGEKAFYDCPNLVKVTIPSAVTDIGPKAFGYLYYANSTWASEGKSSLLKMSVYSGTEGYRYATSNGFSKVILKSLSGAKVTLSTTLYTYNGYLKKPVPTVKLGTKTLKNGTDYTVTYSDNLRPGAAKAIIKGKGVYTGTLTKTFKIKPAKPVAKVTSPQSKTAKVSWAKVPYASGYLVQMKSSSTGSYTTIRSATSLLSYTKTSLKSGKTYYFRVKAYKKLADGSKLYSSYSSVVSVRVK